MRKPSANTGKQDGKEISGISVIAKPRDAAEVARVSSPSKLPMRPPTTGHRRTGSSVISKPATQNLPGTERPPRSVTTRPPISSDNSRPLSIRSKTPDAPASPTTSLQRRPSAGSATGSRHIRNASASTISSIARGPVTGHSRTTSSVTSSTRLPAQSGPPRPSSQTKVLRAPSLSQVLLPPSVSSIPDHAASTTALSGLASRPTFTTLQQRFSPAKSLAPKAATSTFLAAPSPSKLPSNIAISAETARLQAELLQLHLLHKDADLVLRQWKESARIELGKAWADLKKRSERLRDDESREEERKNALALKNWSESSIPGWGLEEKVQVLDEALTGAWKFSEPGSRYGRCVKKFETWMHDVDCTLQARKEGEQLELQADSLDLQWREDCEGLARKLQVWRDNMRNLGDLEDGNSSVAATVRGCRDLVESMYAEIQSMLRIEREVGKQERDWISSMCDEDSDDDGDVGRTVGGAWRL